jgi:hypothetical protein
MGRGSAAALTRRQAAVGVVLMLGVSQVGLTTGFVTGLSVTSSLYARASEALGLRSGNARPAVLNKLEFKPAVDVYAKFPQQPVNTLHTPQQPGASTLTVATEPLSYKMSVKGAPPNSTWPVM